MGAHRFAIAYVKALQQQRLKLAQGREVGGLWHYCIQLYENGGPELRHRLYNYLDLRTPCRITPVK
jgi:hypothetical protein